jgi:hypothetical protein
MFRFINWPLYIDLQFDYYTHVIFFSKDVHSFLLMDFQN